MFQLGEKTKALKAPGEGVGWNGLPGVVTGLDRNSPDYFLRLRNTG